MTVNTTATSPPAPDERFALPAQGWQLTRVADARAGRGFAVEILDDAGAARARIRDLLPEGSTVFTSASETLRPSGIEDDINTSGRYRATRLDEIRALVATPQVVVGSVAAVTESGSLLAASATGAQIPAYGGGAAQRICVVGPRRSFRTSRPRCAESRRMPIRARTVGHAPSMGSRARSTRPSSSTASPREAAPGPVAAPGHRPLTGDDRPLTPRGRSVHGGQTHGYTTDG